MADAVQYTTPPDPGVGAGQSGFAASAWADAIQAADNKAKWAYYNKMLELQTVPMTQIAKDQAAVQAAQAAAQTALQAANLNLQQLTAGQTALQSAAGLQSQEALGAMNLAAQLRGPRNAFQQQAVMEGLNQSGLSNAVGAITGTYGNPLLGKQFAAPQAASLQTLGADMYNAGGQTGQLSPAQLAMLGAINFNAQAPVTGLVNPYLNSQGVIANNIANWGMGTSLGQNTGGSISADSINQLGHTWGVDPRYIQGYVNANGAMPQSPGTLTQWNQLNGFQSPIDASYTGNAPVSSVTGYVPSVGSGSALNAAQSAYNQMYTSGTPTTTNTVQPMSAAAQTVGSSTGASNQYMSSPSPTSNTYTVGGSQGAGALAPGGNLYNQYMSSLPNLNNIDVRNYNRLSPDTQQFLGSAYESLGYSPTDVQNAVSKGATPFTAPTFGSIS